MTKSIDTAMGLLTLASQLEMGSIAKDELGPIKKSLAKKRSIQNRESADKNVASQSTAALTTSPDIRTPRIRRSNEQIGRCFRPATPAMARTAPNPTTSNVPTRSIRPRVEYTSWRWADA